MSKGGHSWGWWSGACALSLASVLGMSCISFGGPGGSAGAEAAHVDATAPLEVADGEPGSQPGRELSTRRHERAAAPLEAAPIEAASTEVAASASALPASAEYGDPAQPATGELRIERAGEGVALLIPRGEELTFDVEVDLGALGEPTVGKVTLSSGVDPYVEGLPTRATGANRERKEVGWLKSTAKGQYLGYELDHELVARHLPQSMPSILLTDTQKGSEARRRKLKVGQFEGALTGVYEHDGHCKGCTNREHFVESKWVWGSASHCDKCRDKMDHRVWRDPLSRKVPEGTLDMLSAVYLARAMVRLGVDETHFPMLDKQKLWNVELKRGKPRKVEVPAGTYECVEIRLKTSMPEGEKDDGKGFQGLFGIQGTIQIFFEARTGVPVLISGSLPVPVIGELDVRVELKSAKGVPAEFAPVK